MARSATRTITNSLHSGWVGGRIARLTSDAALEVYNNGAENITNMISTATGGVQGLPGTRALQNMDTQNTPASVVWRRPGGRRFLVNVDRKLVSGDFNVDVYLHDVGTGGQNVPFGTSLQPAFRNTAFFANVISGEDAQEVLTATQLAANNLFAPVQYMGENDDRMLKASETGYTMTEDAFNILSSRLANAVYCAFRVKGRAPLGTGIASIRLDSSLNVFSTGGHQRIVFPNPSSFEFSGQTFTFDSQRGIRTNANYRTQAVWNVGFCLANNPDGHSNAQSEGDGRICFGLNPIPGGTLPTSEQLQAPGTLWRLRLEGNDGQYNGNSIIGTVGPANDGANPNNTVHRNYRIGTTAQMQAAFGNTRLFEGGGRFVLERVQRTTNVTGNLAIEVALDKQLSTAVTIRVKPSTSTDWIDIPRNLTYSNSTTVGWAALVGNGITQAQFDMLESANLWDVEIRQDLSQISNGRFFFNDHFHFQRSGYDNELYVCKMTAGAIRMWRKSSNNVITEVTSNANIVNNVQPGQTLGQTWFRKEGGEEDNFGGVEDIAFVAPSAPLNTSAEGTLLQALLSPNGQTAARLTRGTFFLPGNFPNKVSFTNWRKSQMVRAPANHPDATFSNNIWRFNAPPNNRIQLLPDNEYLWIVDRDGRAPPFAMIYDEANNQMESITPPFDNLALTRFDNQEDAYQYLRGLNIDTTNTVERDRYIVQILPTGGNKAVTSYLVPLTDTTLPQSHRNVYIATRDVANISTEAALPQGFYVSRFNDRAGYPGLMADIRGRYVFTSSYAAPLDLTTSSSTNKFNFSERSKIQGQGENAETQPEESEIFPTHGWTRVQKSKVIDIHDHNVPTFYTEQGPNIISGSFSATAIDQANVRSQNEVQFSEAQPPSPIDVDNISIVLDASHQWWLQRFAADSVEQNVQYENLGTNRQPHIGNRLLTQHFRTTSLSQWYWGEYATKLAVGITIEGVVVVINFSKLNSQESWSILDLRYMDDNEDELGKITGIFEVEGQIYLILTDKIGTVDSHRLHRLDITAVNLGENENGGRTFTRKYVPNVPDLANWTKSQRKHCARLHISVADTDVTKLQLVTTDPVDGKKLPPEPFSYQDGDPTDFTGVVDTYLCTTIDGKFPVKTENPFRVQSTGRLSVSTNIFEIKFTKER